ncbi:unnamed protein product [Brachionus calyciflorus]|uniref:Uncharacterized protein n=1 Tax=Brachionus calyciflorus TaxID=104777 RepID=A0A814F553_9BILA|nr:unnamed protein product [Brachionus calyciflorus]
MKGVDRKYLQSYLYEFCWRHNKNLSRTGAFGAILEVIKEYNEIFDEVQMIVESIDDLKIGKDNYEIEDDLEENVDFDIPDGDINDFEPVVDQVVDQVVEPVVDQVVEPVVVKSLAEVDDETFHRAATVIVNSIAV